MSRAVCVCVVLVACLVASSEGIVTDFPHRLRGGSVWRELVARRGADVLASSSSAKQFWFTQQLNHSDPTSSQTFEQRYWVDDQYFDPESGPVFLGIRGEGPGGPVGGWLLELAQKHNALAVAIEHRFYGASVPNDDFSVSNLMHLNLDDVLADYAIFIDSYSKTLKGDHVWFTFGGSYSGALSAFFRLKYPNHTTGSLSSSGVVNTIFDFVQFDEQVATSAGPACADILRETTADIEAADKAGVNVRAVFKAPDHLDAGDFYYMVADSGAQAVQYGHRLELCEVMTAAKSASASLMYTFANLTFKLWGDDFGSNCFYDTECLKNDPSRWQPTSRAWRWQKCYQMAYLQAAPASGSIRSQAVSLDYCVQQCKNIFGLQPEQNAAAVIAEFGGAHPTGSNIFFSNGGDDPWQQAAVRSSQSASEPEDTAECADCGHCGDLFTPSSSDPPQLTAQREQEADYIAEWLAAAQKQ